MALLYMTYRVIFDSNIVWKDKGLDKVFNFYFKELQDFIIENHIEHDVSIIVPRVVIKERISKNLRLIDDLIKKANGIFSELKPFGVNDPNDVYKKVDYESILNDKASKFLNDNKIKIIEIPQKSHEEVLERAYKKIKPFSNKDSDKGYKDTMIWLSVLDDAKGNNGDSYIICTNNKDDFDQEILSKEFKEAGNNGELLILGNVQEVKEYLDKKLVLRLDLKALYKQIEQEIRERIGTIMVSVNSYKKVIAGGIGGSMVASFVSSAYALPLENYRVQDLNTSYAVSSVYGGTKNRERVGYDFKDINILSINKESENTYSVRANLEVFPKYSDSEENEPSAWVVTHTRMGTLKPAFETTETLSVEFNYNRKSGELYLVYLN